MSDDSRSSAEPSDKSGKLTATPGGVADEAVDLVSDLGEFALDSFLSEGPIKDVPILGTAVKLFRGAVGVRDWIFLKKLAAFLQTPQRVLPEHRRQFRALLERDPSFQERTATHLVVLIDRLDDVEKALLLAKIFAAFVDGRIDQAQMRRLSALLDRVLVADLQALRVFVGNGQVFGRATYDGLEATGLALVDHSIIRPNLPGERRGKVEGINFVLSPTAVLLVETVFAD